MTANHEHTPTKADLKKAWDFYRAAQANATSRPPNYRAYRLEFLRAWDEINTAAEQRGAERGWDEGYGACWDYHMSEGMAGTVDNPYRADQEGDDD